MATTDHDVKESCLEKELAMCTFVIKVVVGIPSEKGMTG